MGIATALFMPLLGGCAQRPAPDLHPTAAETRLIPPDVTLTMSDGARIPMRLYRAEGPPKAAILALHGFGDSRDAWEFLAPALNRAGIEIAAPDIRGFGGTADRGGWAPATRLQADTREEIGWLAAHEPGARLYVMGESMGGALALLAAASPEPGVSGAILLAPAAMRIGEPWETMLAGIDTVAPGWTLDGSAIPGRRLASANLAALRRLVFDPLTLHESTIHSLYGLTLLMRAAYDAAPRARIALLMMIAGRDQFVLPEFTARLLRRLPPDSRIDALPAARHLLSREKYEVADDLASWVLTPDRALPSGGDLAAAAWEASR